MYDYCVKVHFCSIRELLFMYGTNFIFQEASAYTNE